MNDLIIQGKILNVEIHHGVRESLKTCSEKVKNFAIDLTETRVPRPLEGLGSRGRHHGAGGQPGLSGPDRKIHGQPREVADDVNENGKIAQIYSIRYSIHILHVIKIERI